MKKVILTTISLVVLCSLAMAQGEQKGQKGGRQGGGNGIVQLVGRSDVQTELKLTSTQKDKIAALVPKRGEGGGQRGQGGADRQGGRTQQADLEPKIREILDDTQEKRLAELVIQRAGNRAVFDSKVAGQLDLTSEQKTKISELRSKQRSARPQGGQNTDQANREEARAAREKANELLDAEIGKILTDGQKSKLKELGGKPFKFSAP